MFDQVTPPILAAVAATTTAATVVTGFIAAVDFKVDAGFITGAGTIVLAMAGAIGKMWRSQMSTAAELGQLRADVAACRDRDSEHRSERDEWRAEREVLRHQIDALLADSARHDGDHR